MVKAAHRPRLVLLAAAAGVALTARAGWWQLDRAAQKNVLQAELQARRSMPPLAPEQLAHGSAEAASQHFRPVVLAGHWVADHTVFLDNRAMAGRAGFYVLTPLLLDDGSAVVVQRGWAPRDAADRTRLPPVETPAGRVAVAGHAAPPPSHLLELGPAAAGPIRQNLDLDAFAAEARLHLRPLSVVQDDGPGAPRDGLSRQWPLPAADVQKHYGYAFQWFAMATLIIGLYVWFQLVRPRRARER